MAEKKSGFSVTCSLLSQYIKEKRSSGELGLLEPNKGLVQVPTTLNLLSGLEVSVQNQTDTEEVTAVSGNEAAPLTIFYGGKMMVFENFPADKAADLMMNLVSKGSSVSALSSDSSSDKINASDHIHIPIARRASLHRFMQKRKDRIVAKLAPYQVNASSKTEAKTGLVVEDAGAWLALGQRGTV